MICFSMENPPHNASAHTLPALISERFMFSGATVRRCPFCTIEGKGPSAHDGTTTVPAVCGSSGRLVTNCIRGRSLGSGRAFVLKRDQQRVEKYGRNISVANVQQRKWRTGALLDEVRQVQIDPR